MNPGWPDALVFLLLFLDIFWHINTFCLVNSVAFFLGDIFTMRHLHILAVFLGHLFTLLPIVVGHLTLFLIGSVSFSLLGVMTLLSIFCMANFFWNLLALIYIDSLSHILQKLSTILAFTQGFPVRYYCRNI